MKEVTLNVYRVNQIGIRRALGNLEADIMELCWERDAVKVRDVFEVLSSRRPLAYTTVMTVMSRLSDKGVLEKERCGKYCQYKPLVGKDEFNFKVYKSVIESIVTDLGTQALPFIIDYLLQGTETFVELDRILEEKRKNTAIREGE